MKVLVGTFNQKNVLRDFEIFANFRLKLHWSEARLQTMLGPYNSAQPGGLKVAASRRNTGDTLHTGKVVKLMDKASFPQCTAVHWLREP